MERKIKRRSPPGDKIDRIHPRPDARTLIANHGYVLIFCLWTIVIFGFIAICFTQGTSTAIKAEIAYTERIKNIYAARGACIYATKMLVINDNQEGNLKDNTRKETKPALEKPEKDESDVHVSWKSGNQSYSVKIGDRNCEIGISDESSKINVNKITDVTRANFVAFLTSYIFKMDIITAETIHDSILDWIDADDFHHLKGAEKDYYMSLPSPYEPKNGALETIEELALIKGFSSQVFEKLRDYLTVYGSGKINVNTASKAVLLYVPLVTTDIADAIIQYRTKEGAMNNIDALQELFRDFGFIGGA